MCPILVCVIVTYSAVVLTQDAVVKLPPPPLRAVETEKTELFFYLKVCVDILYCQSNFVAE